MPFVSIVRAQYDYDPQSEEELEIKDGDLLFVLEKSHDDDWWKCKKKAASEDDEEPEGLVPNNYVQEVKPIHQAKALYDYTKQTDEELSFKEDARLDVYDESDPDWTLVGSNGEYGFAPAIYIERTDATAAPPAPRTLAPPPMGMPALQTAVDHGPIPGESDYPPTANPAAQLAGILAQKTGGAQSSPTTDGDLVSPPLPHRPLHTPEESDEEAAPSLPQRPTSQTTFASPPLPQVQFAPPRSPSPPGVLPSRPQDRVLFPNKYEDNEHAPRSPGGFHLYNVHEMVQHMGKNKKMPTTLGINIGKGIIMISPEKSRDGPSHEWTADKLTHYSIEGKHVFAELVRPSRSIDFHAGAKDTAQEIVSALGELAGAVRQEGLREVIAASAGSGAAGKKAGKMLYEFMAQGDDEVTVAVGDEVVILDTAKSDEWWMIRRLKNGKEGVVPSSYVEITGVVPSAPDSVSGLNVARNTVEQNRLEEERLAKEAARKDRKRSDSDIVPPERHSSLAGDTRRTSMRGPEKRGSRDQPKSKPNQARIRTWTDRSGSFKVEAEFIGLREGKIHLHKMNGVKIAVPVAKMAVEDLEYVEGATGASLDEDKPLSDIRRRNTQKPKQGESQSNERPTAGAIISNKDEDQWFDFFLQCGVNPQICQRYAQAFARDQMSLENLPDVNEQVLRTLGLKEGDILRVTKFLDNKYDRQRGISPSPAENGVASGSEGGLFSGPGGALRNNTRKGRPAPAVQTNDVVDENAFKQRDVSPAVQETSAAAATPLTSAPTREPKAGFEDDAWEPKPARAHTPTTTGPAGTPSPAPAAAPVPPPHPNLNEDLASLTISTPVLQPVPAAPTAPVPVQRKVQDHGPAQQPPLANQDIFDKIAALAPAARQQQSQPATYQQQPIQTGFQPQQNGFLQQSSQPQQTALPRQRPAPPPQQGVGGVLNVPPPPRASSAPGFPPQPSLFGQVLLQPQSTSYRPQHQFQQLQPQPTSFQPPTAFGQGYQQSNDVQAMQQNFPALQPQPTGFQPQPQFGQQQTQQFGSGQPNYQQQQILNGQQTSSPFADPPRQQFQPTLSGLSNSFTAQQTGFQPPFNISQPTGMNGPGAQSTQQQSRLPLQQTGGVFGPSQPLGMPPPVAPLVPQKTGPPPPVRFGVQPGAKPLAPQPTGRANLAKATPQNPFGF